MPITLCLPQFMAEDIQMQTKAKTRALPMKTSIRLHLAAAAAALALLSAPHLAHAQRVERPLHVLEGRWIAKPWCEPDVDGEDRVARSD